MSTPPTDDDSYDTKTIVNAITCEVYIERYLESKLSELQIRKIKGEFSDEPSEYYCPDIDQFIMEGSKTFQKTTF